MLINLCTADQQMHHSILQSSSFPLMATFVDSACSLPWQDAIYCGTGETEEWPLNWNWRDEDTVKILSLSGQRHRIALYMGASSSIGSSSALGKTQYNQCGDTTALLYHDCTVSTLPTVVKHSMQPNSNHSTQKVIRSYAHFFYVVKDENFSKNISCDSNTR